MNLKSTLLSAALIASTAVVTARVVSQERSQTEDEMMAQWMKYATPGEPHRHLDAFLGDWTYTMKMWEYPGAEPVESGGTMTYTWILDGHFLLGKYTGAFMEMPFEGMDITGYDNFRGEYVSAWADNMSTSIMVARGQFDAAGRTCTMTGKGDDIMHGRKDVPFKSTTRFDDDGKMVMDMYNPSPEGKMFLSMQITAERKPGTRTRGIRGGEGAGHDHDH